MSHSSIHMNPTVPATSTLTAAPVAAPKGQRVRSQYRRTVMGRACWLVSGRRGLDASPGALRSPGFPRGDKGSWNRMGNQRGAGRGGGAPGRVHKPSDPENNPGSGIRWRGRDLNPRPSGYEPDELTRLLHPASRLGRPLYIRGWGSVKASYPNTVPVPALRTMKRLNFGCSESTTSWRCARRAPSMALARALIKQRFRSPWSPDGELL